MGRERRVIRRVWRRGKRPDFSRIARDCIGDSCRSEPTVRGHEVDVNRTRVDSPRGDRRTDCDRSTSESQFSKNLHFNTLICENNNAPAGYCQRNSKIRVMDRHQADAAL